MEQPSGPGRSLVPCAGTAGAPMATSAGTRGGELSKGKGAEKQEEEKKLGSSSARSSSSTMISRSLASPMEPPVPRPCSFGTAAGGAPMRTRQEATSSAGTGGSEKQEEELQGSTDRSSRSTMIALSLASPMEEEQQQPRDLGLLPSPVLRPCSAGKADALSSTTTAGWQGSTSTGKGKQAEQEEVRSTSKDRSSSSTMISLSLASPPMEVEQPHSPGLSLVPWTCSTGRTAGASSMTTRREAMSASGRCVFRKVMGKQAEEEEEELRRSTNKDESSLKMVPQQPPTLPMDLMLDIIERCNDVRTVIRCALGSKTMLRDILSFLEKRTKANGGFDPSLLMAVSYRVTPLKLNIDEDGMVTCSRTHSIVVLPPGCLGLDTDLLCGLSEPASSRDGLLVLFQNQWEAPSLVACDELGILVANTITGRVMLLPSMGHQGASIVGIFKPALLSVNGVGRSFELLVMYRHDDSRSLVSQIFSSQENEWGAARRVHIHHLPALVQWLKEVGAASTAPTMVGRRVHWLCYTQQYDRLRSSYIDRDSNSIIILALDSELAHATIIEVPEELQESTRHFLNPAGSLILATTTATAQGEERRLSIVAAEALVISMWTLVSTTDGVHSWCRQVVIRRSEVGRPHASVFDAYQQIWFSVFGERSGTVLFWMQGIGLVQLNLGTKKSVVLLRISADNKDTISSQALLYEINLMSVLRGMESP